MVDVKASQADAFIARPNPAQPVVLVFGPDAGLVRERVEALVRNAVDDPSDPFLLARIEADELAANPVRLAEEAQTIPMFGGRRAVWVRASGRYNIVPAVEALLGLPAIEARIVIEAGELRRGTALRNLCERSKNAAAVACYADAERDLARLIDQELREAGLKISSDARSVLLPLLGGDRLASRNELRKLALYARGKPQVEVEDVAAVVANASALAIDAAIDAAFIGKPSQFETEFAKLIAAGTSPNAIVGAVQRYVSELHKLRLKVDAGSSAKALVEAPQSRIHFSRRAAVETTLRLWPSQRLADLIVRFGNTMLDVRRQADAGRTDRAHGAVFRRPHGAIGKPELRPAARSRRSVSRMRCSMSAASARLRASSTRYGAK